MLMDIQEHIPIDSSNCNIEFDGERLLMNSYESTDKLHNSRLHGRVSAQTRAEGSGEFKGFIGHIDQEMLCSMEWKLNKWK